MKYFKVKQFLIHGTIFIYINMWEYILSNDITFVATKYKSLQLILKTFLSL